MYKITIKVHQNDLTKIVEMFSKIGVKNFAVNSLDESPQKILTKDKPPHKKASETVCGKLIINGLKEQKVATSEALGKEYLIPHGYSAKSASPKLSGLYKEGIVDRILEKGTYHYSLKEDSND